MQQKSELPEGWVNTIISEVGKITTGNTPPKKDLRNYGNEYPWVKPGDLDKNIPITETEERLSEKGASLARLLPTNTVLVSCIGNLGKVGIAGTPLATNQQINSISFEKTIVYPKYGYYYCKTLKKWLEDNSSATTIPIINKTRFSEAPFYLPPLAEQHRIVSAIEALFFRLDAANEKLDSVLGILKKFRESVLAAACDGKLTEGWRTENQDIKSAISLFDNIRGEIKKAKQSKSLEPNPEFNCNEIPEKWLLTSLDKITSKITSGSRAWKPYYCDNGPGTFILSQNVRPLKLDLSYKFGVNPPEGDPDRKRAEVINGDLLITIAGNTGDVCRVQSDLSQHYVCQSVALVRPILKELSRFLELYLNSPLHGQLQYHKWAYGDGRPHLKINHLKATAILLPPLPEQQEIVRRVDALFAFADSIEAKVATARKKTEKLRQSILAKAFSGQLVETEAAIAKREGRDYETAEVLREKIKAEKGIKDKKK